MKFVVMADTEFEAEYYKAFVKLPQTDEGERAKFRQRVFSVQGAVEEALLKRWKKSDDFEVGWDADYCYHTCGGIYSEEVFCKEYVDTVGAALEQIDPEGRWTYHTVCEIIVNPDGETLGDMLEDRGEFFVRGGVCFINASRMKLEWRQRIGCLE